VIGMRSPRRILILRRVSEVRGRMSGVYVVQAAVVFLRVRFGLIPSLLALIFERAQS
jgi:hypothetical protein